MITVFGSLNVDIGVTAPRLPAPGETVLGGQALLSPGGKGGNQAHAARRFGAAVHMVGAVGDDAFAVPALQCLAAAGVDTSAVAVAAGQATGLALIVVDAAGENSIVVAPGANLAARGGQLADQLLRDSAVLLLQLETDIGATMALARHARALGCRTMLNASPLASLCLDQLSLDAIDTLIVNRDELTHLVQMARPGQPGQPGRQVGDTGCATVPEMALGLARQHGNEVLVTLGAAGALLADAAGTVLAVPALQVAVLDTTGAGDTYAGVYAAAIADGAGRRRAMEYAGAAAALACTRRGAQAAQPGRDEIEQLLACDPAAPDVPAA